MAYGADIKMDRAEAFRRLTNLGVDRVVLSFQGGNDDGGVDDITAYVGDDVASVGFLHVWNGTVDEYDPFTRTYNRRPATAEEVANSELLDALEQPIYDRFYTFAGDFSVSGQVVWDVTTKTVEMSGEESVYQPFEESFSEQV